MKVWIDKQGGTHFHKENCQIVKSPMFHYEPVEKRLRLYTEFGHRMYHNIRVDGKLYSPCVCMIKELK